MGFGAPKGRETSSARSSAPPFLLLTLLTHRRPVARASGRLLRSVSDEDPRRPTSDGLQ